jgi:hypothetical protein
LLRFGCFELSELLSKVAKHPLRNVVILGIIVGPHHGIGGFGNVGSQLLTHLTELDSFDRLRLDTATLGPLGFEGIVAVVTDQYHTINGAVKEPQLTLRLRAELDAVGNLAKGFGDVPAKAKLSYAVNVETQGVDVLALKQGNTSTTDNTVVQDVAVTVKHRVSNVAVVTDGLSRETSVLENLAHSVRDKGTCFREILSRDSSTTGSKFIGKKGLD